MSAKETLEKVYQQYVSSKRIYDLAKERTKRDKKFAIEIIPFQKAKKVQHESNIINDYFDQLYTDITELYILKIITTFEKIVFDKIDNTYGVIKSIITSEYKKRSKKESVPLSRSIVSFIKNKEDIYSLSGARSILENQISKDLFEDLKEIIEYRNWLSHGKRQNVGKESTLNIGEIKEILMNIIDEIG